MLPRAPNTRFLRACVLPASFTTLVTIPVTIMSPPTHFLVLDFEATCLNGEAITPHQEIIEFPVVAVDCATLRTVSTFRTFVRPTANPQLSKFCTDLTGIKQAQVQGAPTLPEALALFHNWMLQQGFASEAAQQAEAAQQVEAAQQEEAARQPLFVTCGDWDLKHLHLQAEACGIPPSSLPPYWRRFCNIKIPFSALHDRQCQAQQVPASGSKKSKKSKSSRRPGMAEMLQLLGLPLEGRHHSGIDDANNIARIACELARQGQPLEATGGFDEHGAFFKLLS